MEEFKKVTDCLPDKTQEVIAIAEGKVFRCVYHANLKNIFPNGLFTTFYNLQIEGVTHWRDVSPS
jgi:hypothetical protein